MSLPLAQQPSILSLRKQRLATSIRASSSSLQPKFSMIPKPTTTRSTSRHQNTHATIKTAAAASPVNPTDGNNDVKGDMLQPSIANNPIIRFLALSAITLVAARSSAYLPSTVLAFVHIITFATWFGTLAWTTFVFGIVAFKNLPRQTFGKLQSKLFPKYFTLSSIAPAILLATLHYLSSGTPPVKEVYLLATALGSSVINMLYTEPEATKIMFQRYELENAPGARDETAIKALSKQFGKFHGISSLLNLIVVVCAVGHAYYLGGQLSL